LKRVGSFEAGDETGLQGTSLLKAYLELPGVRFAGAEIWSDQPADAALRSRPILLFFLCDEVFGEQ
jgi:hypothetical protein